MLRQFVLFVAVVAATTQVQAQEKYNQVLYPDGRIVWELAAPEPQATAVATPAPSAEAVAVTEFEAATVVAATEPVIEPESAIDFQATKDVQPVADVDTTSTEILLANGGNSPHATPTAPSNPCGSTICTGCTTTAITILSRAANCGCGTPHCVSILPGDPDKPLPDVPGTERPFYSKCVPHSDLIDVLANKTNTVEEIKFLRKKYCTPCCDFEVCVPCESCKTPTKECVPARNHHSLLVCVRQNGNIDVYALDVPGFPKRWVYRLDISLAQFKQEFPNGPQL